MTLKMKTNLTKEKLVDRKDIHRKREIDFTKQAKATENELTAKQ